jgi:hypothetical protein
MHDEEQTRHAHSTMQATAIQSNNTFWLLCKCHVKYLDRECRLQKFCHYTRILYSGRTKLSHHPAFSGTHPKVLLKPEVRIALDLVCFAGNHMNEQGGLWTTSKRAALKTCFQQHGDGNSHIHRCQSRCSRRNSRLQFPDFLHRPRAQTELRRTQVWFPPFELLAHPRSGVSLGLHKPSDESWVERRKLLLPNQISAGLVKKNGCKDRVCLSQQFVSCLIKCLKCPQCLLLSAMP